jgi:hypothetical protein
MGNEKWACFTKQTMDNKYSITYSGTVYGSAPGEGNVGIQNFTQNVSKDKFDIVYQDVVSMVNEKLNINISEMKEMRINEFPGNVTTVIDVNAVAEDIAKRNGWKLIEKAEHGLKTLDSISSVISACMSIAQYLKM